MTDLVTDRQFLDENSVEANEVSATLKYMLVNMLVENQYTLGDALPEEVFKRIMQARSRTRPSFQE